MKASKLILAGLALGALVSLSACNSYYGENRSHNLVYDVRSDQEKAAECVAAFEPSGKAPQVMTYDSDTRTETHLNTQGREVTVTAQNSTDNTSMGMGGKLGVKRPESCTSNDPIPGSTRPKDRNYKNASTGYK
ncbi:hypothetical protein [Asticcacaulis solisilvae]|uniref:hypothetical protein n=1 Tax=Asticcacaulis solisilvae TaxID=1217274 RepID=UPI003FD8EBC4